MTPKIGAIAGLQDVTRLALRVAETELGQLKAKENGLRRNLADLVDRKSYFAQMPRRPDDPALISGAEIRWQQWADQRRGMINTELAQILVQIDQAQSRLHWAFGRDQAAQALARQAVKDGALRRMRRLSYES